MFSEDIEDELELRAWSNGPHQEWVPNPTPLEEIEAEPPPPTDNDHKEIISRVMYGVAESNIETQCS